MQFNTRRQLCRLTFCIVCVLPTVLLAAAAVVLHSPVYRAARTLRWQSDLSSRFGLEVVVTRVDYWGAARRVAIGLEMRDPETHEWLARTRSAECVRTDSGWCVTLSQPEICLTRMSRLSALLHEHVLLRTCHQAVPVQLMASSVNLQGEDRSQSLFDVRCVVEGDAAGTEMLVEFRPAGTDGDERVRLRLVRNRQIDPPATGWELHTGPTGLSCTLATDWLPGLQRFGDQATLQGSVWCEQNPSGWECEIEGKFSRIDLDLLVTGQFKHKLSGLADLTLTKLSVHRGRVTNMAGRLVSDGGVVSQSLLQSAAQSLQLERHLRSPAAATLPYRQLSCEFSLDTGGLLLSGTGQPAHALLSDGQGPLLSTSQPQRQEVLSLVRMLVPEADVQVPATRETALLLDRLPLPTVTLPATFNAENYYSPLRLSRE